MGAESTEKPNPSNPSSSSSSGIPSSPPSPITATLSPPSPIRSMQRRNPSPWSVSIPFDTVLPHCPVAPIAAVHEIPNSKRCSIAPVSNMIEGFKISYDGSKCLNFFYLLSFFFFFVSASQPYLHESRHLHAMKRARGSGGCFLNTKRLQQHQQLQPSVSIGLENVSGSNLRSENGPLGSSATPMSSDVTSVSTSRGMLLGQQDHLSFLSAAFHSHVRGWRRMGSKRTGIKMGEQRRWGGDRSDEAMGESGTRWDRNGPGRWVSPLYALDRGGRRGWGRAAPNGGWQRWERDETQDGEEEEGFDGFGFGSRFTLR